MTRASAPAKAFIYFMTDPDAIKFTFGKNKLEGAVAATVEKQIRRPPVKLFDQQITQLLRHTGPHAGSDEDNAKAAEYWARWYFNHIADTLAQDGMKVQRSADKSEPFHFLLPESDRSEDVAKLCRLLDTNLDFPLCLLDAALGACRSAATDGNNTVVLPTYFYRLLTQAVAEHNASVIAEKAQPVSVVGAFVCLREVFLNSGAQTATTLIVPVTSDEVDPVGNVRVVLVGALKLCFDEPGAPAASMTLHALDSATGHDVTASLFVSSAQSAMLPLKFAATLIWDLSVMAICGGDEPVGTTRRVAYTLGALAMNRDTRFVAKLLPQSLDRILILRVFLRGIAGFCGGDAPKWGPRSPSLANDWAIGKLNITQLPLGKIRNIFWSGKRALEAGRCRWGEHAGVTAHQMEHVVAGEFGFAAVVKARLIESLATGKKFLFPNHAPFDCGTGANVVKVLRCVQTGVGGRSPIWEIAWAYVGEQLTSFDLRSDAEGAEPKIKLVTACLLFGIRSTLPRLKEHATATNVTVALLDKDIEAMSYTLDAVSAGSRTSFSPRAELVFHPVLLSARSFRELLPTAPAHARAPPDRCGASAFLRLRRQAGSLAVRDCLELSEALFLSVYGFVHQVPYVARGGSDQRGYSEARRRDRGGHFVSFAYGHEESLRG